MDVAIRAIDGLQKSLNAVSRMFNGAAFTLLAPLMEAVLTSQLQYAHAARSLAALDLSAIEDLEAERKQLEQRIAEAGKACEDELLQQGENNKTLKDLGVREIRGCRSM